MLEYILYNKPSDFWTNAQRFGDHLLPHHQGNVHQSPYDESAAIQICKYWDRFVWLTATELNITKRSLQDAKCRLPGWDSATYDDVTANIKVWLLNKARHLSHAINALDGTRRHSRDTALRFWFERSRETEFLQAEARTVLWTKSRPKMTVFWVIAPCSLVKVYRRFRCVCSLRH
jgi:hypothetical protein